MGFVLKRKIIVNGIVLLIMNLLWIAVFSKYSWIINNMIAIIIINIFDLANDYITKNIRPKDKYQRLFPVDSFGRTIFFIRICEPTCVLIFFELLS